MRFIRSLLICLALATALVVFLAAAAFVPAVQTWVAQMALANEPGLRGSLRSLSAGFNSFDVEDLHLEAGGAVLTLPSLHARLPLATAVRKRNVLLRSVVAKNWTLDLGGSPRSGDAQARAVPAPAGGRGAVPKAEGEPTPARRAARAVRAALGAWRLPFDLSLDGVDLEGDVLVSAAPGEAPARVHVTAKGGGMSAGREGSFAIDAVVENPRLPANAVAVRGSLSVAMESPRTFTRIEVKAEVSAAGGPPHGDLPLSVDVAASRGIVGETYALDLSRGSRHLATVLARFSEDTRKVEGTWTVDLRDPDFAPIAPNRSVPSFAATGDGHFDAELALRRVHAFGRLKAAAARLGMLAPPLDRLGAVTLDARFDLARSGRSIRVNDLSVSLAGTRTVAAMRSLQPFDFDEGSGDLKVADPGGSLMEASIQRLPLAWLSGLTGRLAFVGGDASGEFILRAADGGIALRPKTPLTASGVSVQSAGRVLGRGLGLSLSLLADYSPKGWKAQFSPLTVSSAGRRLATVEAKASQPAGADQPIAIAAKWNADLDALASSRAAEAIGRIAGRSASGDLSANFGASTEVECTLTAVGHNPGHTIAATMHADVDADGELSFLVPVKVAFGSSVSELSAEGTFSGEGARARVDVAVTGESVALEHLRLLAAPLAAAASIPLPAGAAGGGGGQQPHEKARDRTPFWGDWAGRVKVSFGRLRAGVDEFNDLGGAFYVGNGSIHLIGGHWMLPHVNMAKFDGSISFDAAAEFPYSVKGTAAVDEVDASPLFPGPQSAKEPGIEGRFSIAGTITGNGSNLDDLISRTQEEFRLTSKGGIIRLLKTSVAESIPETPTPVSDALGTVGSAVGWLLGIKGHSADSGRNPVSKNADAVVNFTYEVSEIVYDRIAVTAIRGPDGAIRLSEIAMSAPDEHLTGSGKIAYANDLAIRARPLSAELQFGARGRAAELLSKAGLLSTQEDDQDYAKLNQTFHVGGTLEQLDESEWHDLLVKAATRKPDGGKKGASQADSPRSSPRSGGTLPGSGDGVIPDGGDEPLDPSAD